MKRKKFSRRLYLKKTTIADLNRLMMKAVKGVGPARPGRCATVTIGLECKTMPEPDPKESSNTC